MEMELLNILMVFVMIFSFINFLFWLKTRSAINRMIGDIFLIVGLFLFIAALIIMFPESFILMGGAF